jgi:hypothetical protein
MMEDRACSGRECRRYGVDQAGTDADALAPRGRFRQGQDSAEPERKRRQRLLFPILGRMRRGFGKGNAIGDHQLGKSGRGGGFPVCPLLKVSTRNSYLCPTSSDGGSNQEILSRGTAALLRTMQRRRQSKAPWRSPATQVGFDFNAFRPFKIKRLLRFPMCEALARTKLAGSIRYLLQSALTGAGRALKRWSRIEVVDFRFGTDELERTPIQVMHRTDPTFGSFWWLVNAMIRRNWKHWRYGHFTSQNRAYPLLVISEHSHGQYAQIPCLFGTHTPHSRSFIVQGTPKDPRPGYFFDALRPIKGIHFSHSGPAYPNRNRPYLSATDTQRLRSWLGSRGSQ